MKVPMPRLKTEEEFDRREVEQSKKFWQLASSLSCPACKGKLYGNKELVWCRAYDCSFHCQWDLIDFLIMQGDHIYTENYRGTVCQCNDFVYIFWEDKKYKPLLIEVDE